MRRAFTLVELLTGIVIMTLLVSLILGAVVAARGKTREAIAVLEINQLKIALERYREEVGDYPPCNLNDIDAVRRHCRLRWPRWQWDEQELRDAMPNQTIDQSTSLAFWLAGVAKYDGSHWEPVGFSADPMNPFKIDGSRSHKYHDFNLVNLRDYQYFIGSKKPLIYFEDMSTDYQLEVFPYRSHDDSDGNPIYVDEKKYQLIHAGGDGRFQDSLDSGYAGRDWVLTNADWDNITSFSDGTLENFKRKRND